jgi:signal transduction histidine kinase
VSETTYSTEQLRLLTAIGYQTGLVVENVRLYESAVQAERLAAMGETVAMLSHHAKNILQALSAGTDVVEMALNADNIEKAKQAWPTVQRGLTRTRALILNMLAFSKDRTPQREDINANAVIEECLELIGPQADEKSVAVMSDLDDLPPIPAEADGLQHAFLNLLTNALDAVQPETGIITVNSRYDSMNRNVVVQVIDNGEGIDPQIHGLIFNPFFSSKGQQGTGLGLAVAKKIIDEHSGDISVRSTAGGGTTFTVNLPAVVSANPNETIMSDSQ